MHVYMPWWLDNKKLDFPRGYHIEVWGGLGQPGYGFMGGIQSYPPGGGYGASLKDDYRKYYGATIGFSGRGEMIPNENCYCEIDPRVVDQWGIPVLRFHWKWSDHEYNQVKHMQETFRTLIAEMGGQVLDDADEGAGLRHRHRRLDHPRARRRAHGQRPEDERAQRATARRTTARICSSPTAGRS